MSSSYKAALDNSSLLTPHNLFPLINLLVSDELFQIQSRSPCTSWRKDQGHGASHWLTNFFDDPRLLFKFDEPTELLTKGRFARVAVEIGLCSLLVPGIDVEFEDSKAEPFLAILSEHNYLYYRWRCNRVGHRTVACSTPSESQSCCAPTADGSSTSSR